MPDPILLWNEVSLEANRVSHTNGRGEQVGPPLSARALAIVHLAMYDAYAGVINDPSTLPRYTDPAVVPLGIVPSDDATAALAVAGAAYQSLVKLFPSQMPFFDAVLDGAGDRTQAAHAFGVTVANAILEYRKDDPGSGSVTYKPSPARGKHRPDPDSPNQGFHAPDYGKLSKGFAITKRWAIAPPPLDDGEYRNALHQVRGKGIRPDLMGTVLQDDQLRTPDETLVGLFWGYDGSAEIGTPPRFYNQIVRRVALKRNNTVAQNAAMFAFLNAALADAGILAWEQKYIHELWRPVVGIREHDPSMGPLPQQASDTLADDCDPQWLPLGAPNSNRAGKNSTPNFPSYPSGHATFGAAAFHVTRLFYGEGGSYSETANTLSADTLCDDVAFVSEELNGITTDNTGAARPRHLRKFPEGLFQMIVENGRSRVFLGVHWVFDAFAVTGANEPNLSRLEGGKRVGGVPLGLLIAEDIFQSGNKLAPKKPPVAVIAPAAAAEARPPTFGSSFLR